MLISDFDYVLPEELIAQQPLAERDASRMLVVDRSIGSYRDAAFLDLPTLFGSGDVLVLNNTKVFPARLKGKLPTGAAIELFLIEESGVNVWTALARPGRRLQPGKRILFGNELTAEVRKKLADGRVEVQFESLRPFDDALEVIGETPLPPYIHRPETSIDADRERYQTIYADQRGAIAAPTAGLHFTPAVLDHLKGRGVKIIEVTLHVGYGTFEPVRVNEVSAHTVSPERYSISADAAAELNAAVREQRRIVAVGTTTTRALETAVVRNGCFVAESAIADLTIRPGYEFHAINALLTNFHLPKSSLLVLVSTFGSHKLIMEAYRHAVASGYRFYSYGDCMFIS